MSATPATFYEQLPLPTIDRPFGIHLWPIFDKAFTAVVGYSANDFKFVPFETPMSTIKSTSIFIAIYYCIIFGGREWMRNREPFKLKKTGKTFGKLTVSIGLTNYRLGENILEFVDRADNALYEAKQSGRNTCVSQ